MDICKTEIKKNIILVDVGKELTQPLARLNKQCNFKKVWDEVYNAWNEEEIEKERLETRRIKSRAYCKNNREKVNKWQRKWYAKNRDKLLKTQRKWHKKNPNYAKDYYQKNKDKLKARRKERYEKSKIKE